MNPDKLLSDLLQRAAEAGLKEGQLAEQAGLTPQGLSKAKARGDLRVSTLEALGRQLGVELAWRPVQLLSDAAKLVRSGRLFQFGGSERGEE